jgi:cobalt-zinc-cadmium resistance protein CzcA
MLERILRFSIEHRLGVVAAVIVLAAAGASSLARLPIDAVPDITNNQVSISTIAPSFSPVEIERLVSFPIEASLAGIPGLEGTRSLSRNGFSQVTAVFRDDLDIYFARQQVGERIAEATRALPDGVEPRLGPISTGLGEIYMWSVGYVHPGGVGAERRPGQPGWQPDGSFLTPEGERLDSEVELAAYLRLVQDWIVRPQLNSVPGVAGVDSIGGYVKQIHVRPDPRLLVGYGLGFHDLLAALERNNLSTGAGYIEHSGEAWTVRASGRIEDHDQIGSIVLGERGGRPIYVRDVAGVGVGPELRTGSASLDGEEVVIGTALMLIGENSRTVARAVGERMRAIRKTLPPGIEAKTVLDRTMLVDATIATVAKNLAEGALLVVAVLFAMLGHVRAAVVTALAIPLSILLTAIGMVQTRTSGNLMSLGAIDFGLIVDGSVIIVENCLRRLGERQRELGRSLRLDERLATVRGAGIQVLGPAAYGAAIIIVVYVPLLFLTGIEGKMFRPMALTVIFALGAAFLLSLTFVPAMVALVVRGPLREHESPAVVAARRAYLPLLRRALAHPFATICGAAALFAGALLLFGRLGQEFVPRLSELDLLIHAIRIPSTGIGQSTAMQLDVERALRELPEVALVFSKTGTPEMASDPMPPNVSDTFVILRPRAEWPEPGDTKEDVRRRAAAALESLIGNSYEYTQPIEMRFNEMIAGIRSDVAVKLFGDDFSVLLPPAERIARVLGAVPGAADVRVEQVSGLPLLSVEVDRDALARHGLTAADVHDVVSIAVGGRAAGQVFEGDRRFDIVVRLPERFRRDLAALRTLPVPVRSGFLPLESVARIEQSEGPNQVSRENGKRRIVIQANVRGRDVGSYVEEVQARIDEAVDLPAGSWLEWGGQFENLVEAKRRLSVVVPICFAVILALLYGTLRSWPGAVMVFTGVPLALSGGVLALWLREMPFSLSAAVGFIALSGVAVLNGIVLLSFIGELRRDGVPLVEAIERGATTRLRPILMTALVASLGFVPMALATGTGAEVQRPLATVVIGGLATSTLLSLFVLPALYRTFAREA